jgi:hypothetical protein
VIDRRRGVRIVFLLAVAWASGCGGKSVSQDGDGSGTAARGGGGGVLDGGGSNQSACTEYCERVNTCPGGEETGECAFYCQMVVDQVATYDCSGELRAVFACFEELPLAAVCSDDSENYCELEFEALNDCMNL